MTEAWHGEYQDWSRRSPAGKHYVYLWADGIYFGCRVTDDRPCVLVLTGATADGTKELIAMVDGQRERETSWTALLLDVIARGLSDPPKLATGHGSPGFWLAPAKMFPSTKQQRCWVHKTANVLDKLPKNQQPAAEAMLHEIWMAATREDTTQAFDRFIATCGVKWPRETDCLEKGRAELLAFYDSSISVAFRDHAIPRRYTPTRDTTATATASAVTGSGDRNGTAASGGTSHVDAVHRRNKLRQNVPGEIRPERHRFREAASACISRNTTTAHVLRDCPVQAGNRRFAVQDSNRDAEPLEAHSECRGRSARASLS